jgi:hypothetical protein
MVGGLTCTGVGIAVANVSMGNSRAKETDVCHANKIEAFTPSISRMSLLDKFLFDASQKMQEQTLSF